MATYTGRKMSLAATKFVFGDVNTEPEKEALRNQIDAVASVDATNTTYTQSFDGTDLTLLGSDASTSVVDLSSLGGGNPFDQDLNTTDPCTFTIVNADSAIFSGVISALALTATGQVTAGNFATVGTLTAGATTVSGLLTAESVILSGGTLTSSAEISWDTSTNVEPDIDLAHNTTITLSNLLPRQSVSLSGTISGSGPYTVSIEHTALTTRIMTGNLAELEALTTGDDFEIVCKNIKSQLRVWITTMPA